MLEMWVERLQGRLGVSRLKCRCYVAVKYLGTIGLVGLGFVMEHVG